MSDRRDEGRVVRIGTRGSALARWQSDHVAARLTDLHPHLLVEIVEIVSTGDRVTDVPLSHVEGTGFFTAAIEDALISGRVDVAVHSLKDLPVAPTPGLVVAAVPARAAAEDVLVARDRLRLADLPADARVGTCSARRTAQVLAINPRVACVPLRGNVPTRLDRVAHGELDAIVLARAGLVRLGLAHHITEVFALDRVLPAPGQGALAVQCRARDEDLLAQLAVLDDEETRRAVEAERTVLHVLGGGCSVPVGAHARVSGGRIELTAAVFAPDGRRVIPARAEGTSAAGVGEGVARQLIAGGAAVILAEFGAAEQSGDTADERAR